MPIILGLNRSGRQPAPPFSKMLCERNLLRCSVSLWSLAAQVVRLLTNLLLRSPHNLTNGRRASKHPEQDCRSPECVD